MRRKFSGKRIVRTGGNIIEAILRRRLDNEYRYKLEDYKKGDKLPIVSDTMFHTMLNNESRKQYVSYLLSLILEKDYQQIYSGIEFMREILEKDNYYESGQTVDLVCKIDGEIINIEINNNRNIPSLERNISYLNKLYSGSRKIGDRQYHYNKVLQINLNNFNFKGNKKEIDQFFLQNDDKEILTEKLKIVYIYLPLIRQKLYNKENLNELERLLLVFNEKDNPELNKLLEGDKIMEEYRKEAFIASQDSVVLGLYNKEQEEERLKLIELDYATEKGKEEGLKKVLSKDLMKVLSKV